MEDLRPVVGIGVMILKDRNVLLGQRKGSHGAGDYAFPGGHIGGFVGGKSQKELAPLVAKWTIDHC